LAEELETGMQLLGMTELGKLRPEMVNTMRLIDDMWRPDCAADGSVRSRL
jgi:L-lactate dehydrogenase (cytochrome)